VVSGEHAQVQGVNSRPGTIARVETFIWPI
jgi:hypothetical protein